MKQGRGDKKKYKQQVQGAILNQAAREASEKVTSEQFLEGERE